MKSLPMALLFRFGTADLVAAAQSRPLTEQQLDGAARFLVDWYFQQERPHQITTRSRQTEWGKQLAEFGGATAWVVPNPSGLNRNFRTAELVNAYRELKLAMG